MPEQPQLPQPQISKSERSTRPAESGHAIQRYAPDSSDEAPHFGAGYPVGVKVWKDAQDGHPG